MRGGGRWGAGGLAGRLAGGLAGAWLASGLLAALALPAPASPREPAAEDVQDRPDWPETALARQARELVEIINAGDTARAEAFVREHYDAEAWQDMPPPALAEWLANVRKVNGRLDFAAVRSAPGRDPEREIVVILRSAARESYMGLALTRGADSDRIVGMVIMPARAPRLPGRASGPLTPQQLAAELERYLRRMTETDRFSGSVLVAREGEVVFEGAYGLASRSYGVENRPATRFSLASMGKMFTAVAIMQLVESRRLGLDDTLDRVLPDGWLPPGVASRITIRQLLTHTSGLGDFMASDAFWHGSRLDYRVTEDYRPLLADMRPAFPPGTSWAYSNAGFLLLGAVLEAVTGRPYEEAVAASVWQPAGMTGTALLDLDRPHPDLAEGYYQDDEDGVLRCNTMLRSVRGTAAGGAYSTARDLLRFDQALRSGRLLKPETLEWMWTVTDASRQRMPYGAGFMVSDRPGDRRAGHAGTFPGVSTSLEMHLETGWTVVVLCNEWNAVDAGSLNTTIGDLIARVQGGGAAHGGAGGGGGE